MSRPRWFPIAALVAGGLAFAGLAAAERPPRPANQWLGVRILAHVEGNHGWQASPLDTLENARIALGDDGGVAMIVVDPIIKQPHLQRVYIYDPRGGWRQLLETATTRGAVDSVTASGGRWFAFALNDASTRRGIYTVDVGGGYAAAQAEFVTDWPQDLTDRKWINPTRLADGRVAFGVSGLTAARQPAQAWAAVDRFNVATTYLASDNYGEGNRFQYDRLCMPSIHAQHGFVGCAHISTRPNPPEYVLRDIRFDGTSMSYTGAYIEFDPMPALDAEGHSAWTRVATAKTPPENSTDLVARHPGLAANALLWWHGDAGIERVMTGGSLAIRSHPDGVEFFLRGVVPAAGDPARDEGGIFSGAGWQPRLGERDVRWRRIIGRGDAVVLEDGRRATIDAATGWFLSPRFSMNRHGDIAFIARVMTDDGRGGRVDAGTGLFVIEHGIFRHGFDD